MKSLVVIVVLAVAGRGERRNPPGDVHGSGADRRALAENTRVRQALDNAGTIVLVADEKHQIVYANETAKRTFARLQDDMRRSLPNFSSANNRLMVGLSRSPRRSPGMRTGMPGG